MKEAAISAVVIADDTTATTSKPDKSAVAASVSVTDDDNENSNSNGNIDGNNTKKKKKEKKKPSPGFIIPPQKPKLTKAERRALQEQQRAAKAARQGGGGSGGDKQLQPTPKKHVLEEQQDQQHQSSSGGGQNNSKNEVNNSNNTTRDGNNNNDETHSSSSTGGQRGSNNVCLDLFSHLPQYRQMPNPYAPEFTETLHPDVIELGLKYASWEIQGDNERCRAMMEVFLQVLDDYIPPPSPTTTTSATKSTSTSSPMMNNNSSSGRGTTINDTSAQIDFRHHFDHQVLKPSFQFWTVNCRSHSVSMGNAFTFLKTAVGSLDRDADLDDAKRDLKETIERYLLERLDYADRAIAAHALSKIHDGDVLLTFGHSEAIEVLLKTAHEEHIQFYVWIVDSRPLLDGKKLLRSLRDVGIACGYIQMNALTYVMQQQVTKVFLGASALLVNGSIYGQIGTACIALLAKNHHLPVLVCCETYKISNKVQLESITQNELGNPDDLLILDSNTATRVVDDKDTTITNDTNKNEKSKLYAANILYDVTPDKFVSGIITELGIIPPTSVAVLLREMNTMTDGESYL